MNIKPFHVGAIPLLGGLVLAAGSASAQTAAPAGQAGFEQACAACHQSDGKGIPGAFPALQANAVVLGPPEALAKTVLDGRGAMPAFGAELDDERLAAILTYARSAWGNTAPAVPADLVAAARKQTAEAR
jgi:cytochrome c6